MEIFLLLTVVVVAISSLFVAATLNRRSKQVTKPLIDDAVTDIASKVDAALKSQHQELQSGLDQGRDLAADRQRENATQLEQTTTRLFSDMRRENEKTREQLGQIADQVKDIVSRLTIIELLTADSAAARTSPGEIRVTEVTDPESPLAVAVLVAESDRERDGWGNPPQLYALVGKAAASAADPELGTRISTAPDDSLIPVKQKPLAPGEPLDVLAHVQWPDDVTGCVLVTERVVPPPGAGDDEHPDPGQVERWARDHPGGRPARLAVGVCRNGDYTCVMRLKEDDSVQLDPRLADGLVTVLLATF